MIIVFLFHYRCKFQEFVEFDEFKSEFEYIWQLGFECKHVGSVGFVGPATRFSVINTNGYSSLL